MVFWPHKPLFYSSRLICPKIQQKASILWLQESGPVCFITQKKGLRRQVLDHFIRFRNFIEEKLGNRGQQQQEYQEKRVNPIQVFPAFWIRLEKSSLENFRLV